MLKEYRIALRNSGLINPESIDEFIAADGYQALRKALKSEPLGIYEEIYDSGLRGRGGAGFPTGAKEKAAAVICSDCEKYVICNADEGEPGTFKDRIIMETDPHTLIEGLVIAAYSIGAHRGFVYIRGEYELSIQRVQNAIEQAYGRGFLGKNILGSGFDFDLEVRRGAGSYLCGEELTLIESVEGKRGYPRIKPPYPAEKGLWGAPTLINNVETLANFPAIILNGAKWYRSIGTENSPGTKIFTISGDVSKPGFYEFPMGITLRELIYDVAGGIRNGKPFGAALIGGAAGTFASVQHLDVPMGYDKLREVGLTLGSGAVIVMDGTRNLNQTMLSILKFFKHESCGKCIPCRVGTAQLYNTLKESLAQQSFNNNQVYPELIRQAELIARTSLCPLGQSPILPLKSLWEHILVKQTANK
ncbi:MAG: NADH-ubiquinone oxidoreductase-F iron-sulfur binding region domain-containing protein [Tenuifilum sp.]|uniref:complex I 51 kDa subunit family protein n=1 Tax=Tenuifilum sp. TaxID=2760880 RepID=UPI0030A56C1E